MTAVELATSLEPVGPASPAPVGGYIVACTVFLERGFGVPLHQFLCSLLRPYVFELHHLTPSGILHMVAFVTLCEPYIGIESHFHVWSYFFRARLQQGSNTETAALGSVDILVCSRSEVEPDISIPLPDPPVRWRRE
jgi:hypothetical protein